MKTLIEMARKAGNDDLFDAMQVAFLERFADLVRAEALAEQPAQQQEPVAVTRLEDGHIKINYLADPFPVGPLYAAPLQSAQPYPDNFIDALKYDVAKRDSEAQQAYEDAFVNGTGVMLGDKRIDPASIYKQPEPDNTYNYAKNLAEALFKRHFASDEHYASGRVVWGVNDTVIGILTQIDNMVADMVRRPAQQQQQQEPAAWMHPDGRIWTFGRGFDKSTFTIPLYTTPPHRKPLTDEEILHRVDTHVGGPSPSYPLDNSDWLNFARAIEAKLREKNA